MKSQVGWVADAYGCMYSGVMTTTRTEPQMVTADNLVTGMWIIPPSKKRAVEIVYQLSNPENANYFEFAAIGSNGGVAVRLHRSTRVEVVAK